MLDDIIKKCRSGSDLTASEAQTCLEMIFKQDIDTQTIIALLQTLSQKGESVSEIIGFAKAMRAHGVAINLGSPVMDVCGTGGSGKNRFNVSTAASFILASAGIPIAKHGNKGSTKPNGSFDFLETLGIPIHSDIETIQTQFKKTQLAFLFARFFHPAMSKVAPARKEIPGRTIFNILGPLCNPASITHQLIGTTQPAQAKKIAEALLELGIKKAAVICGYDGLDELSLSGPSRLFEVGPNGISETVFDPKTCCDHTKDPEVSGLVEDNVTLFREIFKKGQLQHPVAELTCLNAGAAFYVFGATASIAEGKKLAENHLASKLAWQKVEALQG